MSLEVREFVRKDLIPLGIVVLSSLIYSLGFIWFLAPVGVYAGGLTGIAQLVQQIFKIFNININIGLLLFILNVPCVLIGYKSVSRRFAVFSILSVVLQSVLTSGIIPFVDFGVNSGSGIDYLVCAIIGAVITGFGCGLALRFGTSTGGLDILAQAANLKGSKISVGTITLISNVFIGCIGGGVIQKNLAIIIYTFIRIVLTSLTVDKIHTAYSFVSLNIISERSNEITDVLLTKTNRGCTICEVCGAYTHNKKYDLYMVISSYEIHEVMDIIRGIDPKVFVVVSPVKRIFGNYIKKTII